MIIPAKPVLLAECAPYRSAEQDTVLTFVVKEYTHGMTRDYKGRLVAVLHRNLKTGAAAILAVSGVEP